jgi:hypothetical protein
MSKLLYLRASPYANAQILMEDICRRRIACLGLCATAVEPYPKAVIDLGPFRSAQLNSFAYAKITKI